MKTIKFNEFVKSLSSDTANIKVLGLTVNGYNSISGVSYLVTIKQTLRHKAFFYSTETNERILQLEINTLGAIDNNIPYMEEIFLQAFFRKYILDNFN